MNLVGINAIDTVWFDDSNGGVAQVDGFLDRVSLRIVFAKDTLTGPGVKRGFVGVGVVFFDALVVGVVQVVGYAIDAYQAVSGIVLVGVLSVIDQVAVGGIIMFSDYAALIGATVLIFYIFCRIQRHGN